MTRASAARIAARAARHDPDYFPLPPEGMLSERVDLIDYRMVMGLIHPDDSPILVMIWDGERFRRLLPDQASKLADEYEASEHAWTFAPVIEALRKLVRRVGEIETAVIMRRASSLASMQAQGRA